MFFDLLDCFAKLVQTLCRAKCLTAFSVRQPYKKRQRTISSLWLRVAFNHTKTKKTKQLDGNCLVIIVGVPGFEPGKAGPESAVLPLHHTPMSGCFYFSDAKVVVFVIRSKFFLNFSQKLLQKLLFPPSIPFSPTAQAAKVQLNFLPKAGIIDAKAHLFVVSHVVDNCLTRGGRLYNTWWTIVQHVSNDEQLGLCNNFIPFSQLQRR